MVRDEFKPNEVVENGNCFSFDYKQCQIDLIVTPSSEFETSYRYFAYNDLGNFLGRVAHSMGLKLGHDGLSYNWRIDTYQFKNVILLTNWEKILPVLGYSSYRYYSGFNELEDIFEFAASSPFFNKDIFQLHNRNHTARVRDAKRKSYTAFLEWMEPRTDLPSYPRKESKEEWLPYLFEQIPGFKETYDQVQEEWVDAVEFKRRYNGELVMKVTGLEGKELGNFMKYIKEQTGNSLQKTILTINEEIIPTWINYYYRKMTDTLPKVELQFVPAVK